MTRGGAVRYVLDVLRIAGYIVTAVWVLVCLGGLGLAAAGQMGR